MGELLAVMVAGGCGAAMRFAVDAAFARWNRQFPVGILVVNLSGSFLLGCVLGMGAAQMLSAGAVAILGVGFCGGFTTFSTAAVDAAKLLVRKRFATFCWQWFGGFVLCVLTGALGYGIGAC